LEHRTKQLEVLLHQLHQTNVKLVGELEKYKRESGVATHSQPTLGQLASNSLTLSHELFSSQDGHQLPLGSANDLISQLGLPDRLSDTVNPASLSPELHPVPDSVAEAADDEDVNAEEPTPSLAETSLDVTQHPAEMLCDLQCPSMQVSSPGWLACQKPTSPALSLYMQLGMMLTIASTFLSVCRQPLSQIALALRAGSCLPPTPSILNTIIWLVTRRRHSRTSTLVSSSPRNCRQPPSSASTALTSSNLRLQSLQRILTCSPTLARPLLDATMEVLRLVSEGSDDRFVGPGAGSRRSSAVGDSTPQAWPPGEPLPSSEALFALLWAIRVEERRWRKETDWLLTGSPGPTPRQSFERPTSFVLKLRRKGSEHAVRGTGGVKRQRRV